MEERDYLIIVVVTLVSLDAAVSNVCPDVLKEYIHPDGTKECIFCTECPRGYVKKENCSYLKDTVCEKCTVCEPGQKLVKNCSQFEDSMCKQCPGGTFSLNQNSLDCRACGSCDGKLVGRKCTPSTDIVCKEHSYLTATWDLILFIVAVAVAVVFLGLIPFIWLHRKLKLRSRNKQMDDLEGSNRNKQMDDLERSNLIKDKDEGLGQSSKEEKAEKNEISAEEAAEIAAGEAKEKAAREARKALDEFKKNMKNRISERSNLSKGEQLEKLGLSVGELIIDSSQETTFAIESEKLESVVNPNKPQLNTLRKNEKHLRELKIVSERDEKLFFNETQIERFFGIFVGSKYIMTSLHSLEKKLGRKTREDKNIVIRLKVAPCVKKDDNIQTYSVKSVPVYENESLDVAVIEILEPSPFASPVNLSMHSAYEADNIATFQDNMVLPIHVFTGQEDRKKAFDRFYSEKYAKVEFEPDTLKTINEQVHAKHDDIGTNDKMVEGKGADVNSGRNLKDFDNSTESGNARPGESEINNASKVFWKSKGYVCAGLPCFFFDEKNNMYHLFCISNFPKFYTSLSKFDQKEFRKHIKIQYGTSMVALHKDMSVSNKMLCEELFVDLS